MQASGINFHGGMLVKPPAHVKFAADFPTYATIRMLRDRPEEPGPTGWPGAPSLTRMPWIRRHLPPCESGGSGGAVDPGAVENPGAASDFGGETQSKAQRYPVSDEFAGDADPAVLYAGWSRRFRN